MSGNNCGVKHLKKWDTYLYGLYDYRSLPKWFLWGQAGWSIHPRLESAEVEGHHFFVFSMCVFQTSGKPSAFWTNKNRLANWRTFRESHRVREGPQMSTLLLLSPVEVIIDLATYKKSKEPKLETTNLGMSQNSSTSFTKIGGTWEKNIQFIDAQNRFGSPKNPVGVLKSWDCRPLWTFWPKETWAML